MSEAVDIKSDDFWVKFVEMLQQNWALIEPMSSGCVCVHFIHDGSGVFDEIAYSSNDDAITALKRKGFSRYADDQEMKSFIRPPSAPFHREPGPIYSSGRYWRS